MEIRYPIFILISNRWAFALSITWIDGENLSGWAGLRCEGEPTKHQNNEK